MRNKSTDALLLDLERKCDDLMEQFKDFTGGTRVLLLLQRSKDGGHNKEHRRRRARYVTHNPEQLRASLLALLLMQATSVIEYRIYLSVAARDIRKAEMEFKQQQLLVDFSGGENKQFFYEHLEDKWISALMTSNPVKDGGYFIIDIDQADNSDALIWMSENNIEEVKRYKTKQGWHMVVKPFNRTLFPKELGEVKRDGLLLLSY